MGHLFFSYARDDSDFAIKLAHDLRSASIDLWIDQLDIRAGQRWERAIQDAIQSSTGLLVVLSPRSVASDNVLDEVSYARDHAKVIFPVLLEKCEIPLRLHRLQYIDFTRDYVWALSECQRSVEVLLGTLRGPSPRQQGGVMGNSPASQNTRQPLDLVRVLWVDDTPNNNKYERLMMEKLGATFVLCTDTSEALRAIAQWPFDLVLSDMGRPSSQSAGYELLQSLRQQGSIVPFVIYAGSNSQAHKEEARNRGAQGSTNDPRELLELVFSALKRVPK